jgi:putative DNA primase/helicase
MSKPCERSPRPGTIKPSRLAGRPEPRKPRPVKTDDERSRVQLGLRIWHQAQPIQGTLAETYLTEHRALTLDMSEDISHVLRYHPRCPFCIDVETGGGTKRITEYASALVALLRDIHTNEPRAIQRTRLTPDGKKIDRRMLGPSRGAAIKLDADEDVTLGLVVAEGCETGLAARQLGYRPTWALGSSGAIRRFPVVAGIEGLTILAEAGETSRKDVQECFERYRSAGRDVIVRRSSIGSDINDAIRGTR